MAKFNIEVELDWVDGEDGYTIDEEIKEQVVSGIKDALLKKATTEAVEAVDDKIAEKILEAEGTIQATVDQFVANVCEEKIGKIIIPEKKNTWSEEVTYKPLSEYIGERFELFLTEKRYDRDGCIASYSSDRKLSAADLLTGRYLEKELGKKVETLIASAKREVEESLINSFEQKLKENLAKDTIERMNIPEAMLVEKNLKEALEYYIKGKPVTALWIGEDGGMNAMPLSDILDLPENHFLVDVPAVANPDFEQAVQEMTGTDQIDPEEIIQAVYETQESIIPPNGAGGKDGRRNGRSSGKQYQSEERDDSEVGRGRIYE